MKGLEKGPMPLDEINDRLSRDHLPIDPDPFAEIDQVRGGIKPDPIARPHERHRQEMAHGAFPVGARDVDSSVCPVRIAQIVVERLTRP